VNGGLKPAFGFSSTVWESSISRNDPPRSAGLQKFVAPHLEKAAASPAGAPQWFVVP